MKVDIGDSRSTLILYRAYYKAKELLYGHILASCLAGDAVTHSQLHQVHFSKFTERIHISLGQSLGSDYKQCINSGYKAIHADYYNKF